MEGELLIPTQVEKYQYNQEKLRWRSKQIIFANFFWAPKTSRALDDGSVLMSLSKHILSLTRNNLEELFKRHAPQSQTI